MKYVKLIKLLHLVYSVVNFSGSVSGYGSSTAQPSDIRNITFKLKQIASIKSLTDFSLN